MGVPERGPVLPALMALCTSASTGRLAKVLNAGLAHRDCDTGGPFGKSKSKKKAKAQAEAQENYDMTMRGLEMLERIFKRESTIVREEKEKYAAELDRFLAIANAMIKERSGRRSDQGHNILEQYTKTMKALNGLKVVD